MQPYIDNYNKEIVKEDFEYTVSVPSPTGYPCPQFPELQASENNNSEPPAKRKR